MFFTRLVAAWIERAVFVEHMELAARGRALGVNGTANVLAHLARQGDTPWVAL